MLEFMFLVAVLSVAGAIVVLAANVILIVYKYFQPDGVYDMDMEFARSTVRLHRALGVCAAAWMAFIATGLLYGAYEILKRMWALWGS